MKLTLGLDSYPSRASASQAYFADELHDADWQYEEYQEDYSYQDYGWQEEAYWEEEDVYPYDDWYDYEEEYYHDEPPTVAEETFSVTEYEEIMATYIDARKKMNDMRLARGFYPVVAMIPSGLQKDDRGKGKVEGKGKGKRKSGQQSSSSRSPSYKKGKGIGNIRVYMPSLWPNRTFCSRLPSTAKAKA